MKDDINTFTMWQMFQLETCIDDCQEEDQKKVVEALLQWGCCSRCVLRFLCEKQQYIFRKSLNVIVVDKGTVQNFS